MPRMAQTLGETCWCLVGVDESWSCPCEADVVVGLAWMWAGSNVGPEVMMRTASVFSV